MYVEVYKIGDDNNNNNMHNYATQFTAQTQKLYKNSTLNILYYWHTSLGFYT